MQRMKELVESRLGIISLRCEMCSCQHKLHWSVVAILVNLVAIVMYTTGVASRNWAVKTQGDATTNTGLFMSCVDVNGTCYDNHFYFDNHDYEKGLIMAGAILNVFALVAIYVFFIISLFFLCGLYQEKALATSAVCASYIAGVIAIVGIAVFAVSVKRLSYSLGWSFILAILGAIVNLAAGVLMCVGRNISHSRTKKKKTTALERHNPEQATQQGVDNPRIQEELSMEETNTHRKKVWPAGAGPEVSVAEETTKKKLFGGASP